jgi:hypothetical protein
VANTALLPVVVDTNSESFKFWFSPTLLVGNAQTLRKHNPAILSAAEWIVKSVLGIKLWMNVLVRRAPQDVATTFAPGREK